ncbi:MAG: hypothetical protein ABSB40_09325 [Nitrososphaeria archaeon]
MEGCTKDVAGIIENIKSPKIVSIEAKLSIDAREFLSAVSQGEMYQEVSTIVYLAFPIDEINSFIIEIINQTPNTYKLCCKKTQKRNNVPLKSKVLQLTVDLRSYLRQKVIKFFGAYSRKWCHHMNPECKVCCS